MYPKKCTAGWSCAPLNILRIELHLPRYTPLHITCFCTLHYTCFMSWYTPLHTLLHAFVHTLHFLAHTTCLRTYLICHDTHYIFICLGITTTHLICHDTHHYTFICLGIHHYTPDMPWYTTTHLTYLDAHSNTALHMLHALIMQCATPPNIMSNSTLKN